MKVTLDISEKQLEELLLVLFCGDYVITSVNSNPNKRLKIVRELFHQLLSQSEEWRYDEGVTVTPKGRYKFTELKEMELYETMQAYDYKEFWSNLAWHLAERDVEEKSELKDFSEYSIADELEEEMEREDQYMAEFEENGLQNLRIVKEGWE